MLGLKIFILCILSFFTLLEAKNTTNPLSKKETTNISKFYKKYLRKSCRATNAGFAQKYTQQEWKKVQTKQTFIDELFILCPHASSRLIRVIKNNKKTQNFQKLLQFSIEYAQDTGKYPPS